MKRFTILCLLSAAMLAGCKPYTTAAPPLAPGYENQADQTMGSVLAGARAFFASIQQQSASGQVTLSATEKQAFNTFGVSLNAADSIYLAYHNGTATQAQAQAAVDQVKAQQAALPLPGATK